MAAFALIFLQLVALLGTSGADPADEAWQRSYRLWFTKSWGDDHVCLTETKFLDRNGAVMEATYKSQTSCYGCSSCAGCQHRYGDPLKQFDGIDNEDTEDSWTCTAPGTFVNSLGSQNVIFTLPARPAMLYLNRPSMDGDWVARDWQMEEQQDDGTWWIVVQVTDGAKALSQSVNVPATGGQPLYDLMDLGPGWTYELQKEWTKSYPSCGGQEQSPILIDSSHATMPAKGVALGGPLLQYSYMPLKNRALFNTGLTVQVPGEFGSLTLPGGVYDANQFHLHMPAEHQIGDERSVGELHIVHQKRGSRGTDHLVMVSIILRLPLEHEELVDTEPFFYTLGLDKIPSDGGHSMPFNHSVDLNAFAAQLNGPYFAYHGSLATPPCTEGVQWYVMANSAAISGANVVEFKKRFPSPMNARTRQSLGDRKVLTNEMLTIRDKIKF